MLRADREGEMLDMLEEGGGRWEVRSWRWKAGGVRVESSGWCKIFFVGWRGSLSTQPMPGSRW